MAETRELGIWGHVGLILFAGACVAFSVWVWP
jgi:hypothetical protein